jgi:hypothetical protein
MVILILKDTYAASSDTLKERVNVKIPVFNIQNRK